jgi:hypothetical protein
MHGIMERAEARGLRRRAAELIPHIGIDDKALCKRHSNPTQSSTANPDGPFRERRESLIRSTASTMFSLHRDGQYRTHAFEPTIAIAMGSPLNSRARAKLSRAAVNGYCFSKR